jgi:hypothetical protein
LKDYDGEPDCGALFVLPLAASSTEVPQSIKALMDEGTEDSPTAAVGKVKELRGLLDQGALKNIFTTRLDEKTLVFSLSGPTTEQSQEEYIRAKLGAKAQVLIDRLKRMSVDVSGRTPELNTCTLRTDSNNKDRSEQMKLYGGELVDAIQGVNLAIEAVSMANASGINLKTLEGESCKVKCARIKKEAEQKGLDEGTATILAKLSSGIIRVGGGALCIDALSGELCTRARDSSHGFPNGYAFGPGPAPESKI